MRNLARGVVIASMVVGLAPAVAAAEISDARDLFLSTTELESLGLALQDSRTTHARGPTEKHTECTALRKALARTKRKQTDFVQEDWSAAEIGYSQEAWVLPQPRDAKQFFKVFSTPAELRCLEQLNESGDPAITVQEVERFDPEIEGADGSIGFRVFQSTTDASGAVALYQARYTLIHLGNAVFEAVFSIAVNDLEDTTRLEELGATIDRGIEAQVATLE